VREARADPEQRVFDPAVIRRDGLFGLLAGALLPTVCLLVAIWVNWIFGGNSVLAGLAGLGVGLGLLAVAYDYLAVGPSNAGMRRRLIEKLRRLGELSFDPASPEVYFVGLAYRERRSSRWETDDEIGFLEVTFDGLIFHGDRLSFRIDYADLVQVDLEPVGGGLPSSVGRLSLITASGEPFDRLAFSSRERPRLSASNAVTATLHEAIRTRWLRRAPATRLQSDLRQTDIIPCDLAAEGLAENTQA